MAKRVDIDVSLAWLERLNKQLEPLAGKVALADGRVELQVPGEHSAEAREIVRKALLTRLDKRIN